ncbi:hypothetical protein JYU34_014679 [Plutella xylostella]|uniref:Hexosyltransferase n=1 Tax=Plutella xylostella TaxID=51655 RepID=A0ABQ7Q8Y4_PLUXY|nr:hypothetical protein JYU34_014679 [Plutella xylostella]
MIAYCAYMCEGSQLVRELYHPGYSVAHAELCPDRGRSMRLMMLICSAPSHFHRRLAIRLTWGYKANRRDIAVAFLLGQTESYRINQLIDQEDKLWGDVIRGQFIDTYSNMTLKTLSLLDWVSAYCQLVPRILKVDDDVFINVPKLLDFITAQADSVWTIWGNVRSTYSPNRERGSKYYVSKVIYPSNEYPPFASGPAYLMTSDVAQALRTAAYFERYFPLEDVFFTGLLAQKLLIRRQHAPEFAYSRLQEPDVFRHISIHGVSYLKQFYWWNKLFT